ncbi:MAG: hypothetical protein WBG43_03290 [Marinifilaceae bacterium]
MIINSLGGKVYYHQHALNSAKLTNNIQPEYLSTLVLSYLCGEEPYKSKFKGEFISLNTISLIAEMKLFIENIELDNTVFKSDDASNYLVLRGSLNKDNEELLEHINNVLDDPTNAKFRPEWMLGL